MIQNDHFDDNEYVFLSDIRDKIVHETLEVARCSFLSRDCFPSPHDNMVNINSTSFLDFSRKYRAGSLMIAIIFM